MGHRHKRADDEMLGKGRVPAFDILCSRCRSYITSAPYPDKTRLCGRCACNRCK